MRSKYHRLTPRSNKLTILPESIGNHAGAYLGDGLHGGAITSAIRVAQLIDVSQESISLVESKRERIPLA